MRCTIYYKQPEKIPRWTMLKDVVYYHCSEFQVFRSLNGLHFSVLSLYRNSFQNWAWFCLHFFDYSKPNKLMSFSHVLYSCHWSIMGGYPSKIDQSLFFFPLLIHIGCAEHTRLRPSPTTAPPNSPNMTLVHSKALNLMSPRILIELQILVLTLTNS